MALLKFALLAISYYFLFLSLILPHFSVNALNIGIQATNSYQVDKQCSRKCESEFCSVPPFLRYGKYCGLLYSGCPGEKPCDGLDYCCMNHDNCIGSKNNDYLSKECSEQLLSCIDRFKKSRGQAFQGSKCQIDEVTNVINLVIQAALLAGDALHKP